MVRKLATREVPRDEAKEWTKRKWKVLRKGQDGFWTIRKELTKWERFEVQLRTFFQRIEFEDALDPLDFNYRELGPQVDVCGGVGEHLIIVDCTSKDELGSKSLRSKIADNVLKIPRIREGVQRIHGKKYRSVHFVVCTEDVEISDKDKEEAAKSGIQVLDREVVEQWMPLARSLGGSLRYHVLEAVSGTKSRIEKTPSCLEYEGFRLPARKPGQELYVFGIDPETLIKLSYVYRLKYSDPKGYQRDLRVGKLRAINSYIAEAEHVFPNNVILAFDKDHPIKWRAASGKGKVELGKVSIPAFYNVAEVIDGQHRVFGYQDFTKDRVHDAKLAIRRREDRIIVVALSDPDETERPELYVAVNSNQSRISTREIWSLMGRARPDSKMGFISNLVIELANRGALQGEIQIPGVTPRGRYPINVANLGKGISDRHLIDQAGPKWNLWRGDRSDGPYPIQSAEFRAAAAQLNLYFRVVKSCQPKEWKGKDSFLRSNNGVNVLLRVLDEVLRFNSEEGQRNLAEKKLKKLLRPALQEFLRSRESATLSRMSSSESGREREARGLMELINARHPDFARLYLKNRRKRKK